MSSLAGQHSQQDIERYLVEINHLQYRAQAHRSLMGDCKDLAERGNTFAPVVLASLEAMAPSERADYHKVREQCLKALETAQSKLAMTSPDENDKLNEHILRQQIDLFTGDQAA